MRSSLHTCSHPHICNRSTHLLSSISTLHLHPPSPDHCLRPLSSLSSSMLHRLSPAPLPSSYFYHPSLLENPLNKQYLFNILTPSPAFEVTLLIRTQSHGCIFVLKCATFSTFTPSIHSALVFLNPQKVYLLLTPFYYFQIDFFGL